ncbi:MAG: acyl carrier protein [Dinoroseobacter sp.]|nr:acyl carrier protein [Dinoroseobacter sp.]MBL4714027.1 acyl carrier protein [Alcanivorax sp.]MEA3258574.1 acyl carrier protein [Pseudomonadota bacterium]HAM77352.1 acyl carrier protein [Alcanivorax sp.]
MQSYDDIFPLVRDILVEMFELEPEQIQPATRLYEDLDIDSIDAVDIVVKLKEVTGRKVKPEDFKTVRTIDDVVRAVQNLLED